MKNLLVSLTVTLVTFFFVTTNTQIDMAMVVRAFQIAACTTTIVSNITKR